MYYKLIILSYLLLVLICVLTSLGHIHHPSVLVHSHSEYVAGEELRVPGPAEVQFVQWSTHQLVVLSEARRGGGMCTEGSVQSHHY